MRRELCFLLGAGAMIAACAASRADTPPGAYDWQLPDESLMTPFKDTKPILFVNRSQSPQEWDALSGYWNPGVEKAIEPRTGRPIERACVRIKVPLGLTQNPPVPPENPITVAKWSLGKQLYYDTIVSSDGSVACATCHDPKKGFTDGR